MAGKVLATDLDGTLFFPKSRRRMIPKRNVAFLKKWVADGNRVVFVTSRTDELMDIMREKMEGVPFDMVGGDGAFVRVGDEIVHSTTFNPETITKFIADLRRDYNPSLLLLTSKRYSMIQIKHKNHGFGAFGYMMYQLVQGIYREPCVKDDTIFYSEIAKGDAYKLMACIGLRKSRQRLAYYVTDVLAKEYPELEFSWLNQFIEVTPKGCNKASGLSFYLDYIGVSKENVFVIGDSGNDAPMFKEFYENSFCMFHSPLRIQKMAKHVVLTVADLESYLYPSVDSKETKIITPRKKKKA